MIVEGEMKELETLVLRIDSDVFGELIPQSEKDQMMLHCRGGQSYYTLPPITKCQCKVQDESVMYGNGIFWLLPYLKDNHKEYKYITEDLIVCTDTRSVRMDNKIVELTEADFDLLICFLNNPNRILTRNILIQNLEARTHHTILDNTLSVHISRLKKKLDNFQGLPRIKTHYKIGYSWNSEVIKELIPS